MAAVIGANALGVLVAIAAASPAEGHLFAIIAVLGVTAILGIGPAAAFAGPAEAILPFHHLSLALLDTAGTGVASLLVAPLTAGRFVLLVLAVAPRLFRAA